MSTTDVPASEPSPQETEISLVVIVQDEEENIVPFITEVHDHMTLPHQICIVFDSDDDTTLRKKDEVLRISPNAVFVKNELGKGVINAFKTGFGVAKAPYVVPIMADLSDTPETINLMYAKIREGYDLVVGSRYCPGGKKIGGPFLKYLLSYLANMSLHWLTGIPTHDMTNAFIMHRKEILDQIHIRSTGGFEITMEIIAKSIILGAKVTEVPTINRERVGGKSKFKILKWMVKYLYWYFYILGFSVIHRITAHYLEDTRKQ
ncbi:MAG: glycosyltransferase [Deltaproteobacteria bacterium]|nr:glycosyltransferase [Deltaproteobacteria bacterium]